jgi:cytochrome c oxidase assembly protein subunit 15
MYYLLNRVTLTRKLASANGLKNLTASVKKLTTLTSAESGVNPNRTVGLWLAGCSGMVAGAVVLGGITRLTESGLSMTDWSLVKEMFKPTSDKDWQSEFDRYKEFPEWKYLNKDRNMQLDEFKRIFLMEYWHRMWGRAIGLAFGIPVGLSVVLFRKLLITFLLTNTFFPMKALIFWRKGFFNSTMKKRVLAFGSLLGFQGFLGWYMVKSGLNEPKKATDIPRVSQYRLAAHLSSAFLLYSGLLWTALDHLLPKATSVNVTAANRSILKLATRRSHYLMALIFTTAGFGAFVAGLDAGLVYNSFPKFADRWIPDDLIAYEPKWTNLFENPTTVQFTHRLLGIATITAICLYTFKMKRHVLPMLNAAIAGPNNLQSKTNLKRMNYALNSMFVMSFMQVGLGISTLLLYVPIHLAATHQFGSLTLLSFSIWLANELKRIPK